MPCNFCRRSESGVRQNLLEFAIIARQLPVANSKATPNVNAFTDDPAFARTYSRRDLSEAANSQEPHNDTF
jgi:hypothetical protein